MGRRYGGIGRGLAIVGGLLGCGEGVLLTWRLDRDVSSFVRARRVRELTGYSNRPLCCAITPPLSLQEHALRVVPRSAAVRPQARSLQLSPSLLNLASSDMLGITLLLRSR